MTLAPPLKHGVFSPPTAEVTFAGLVFAHYPKYAATIRELNLFAGDAIGSAILAYPTEYARDASPEMGRAVTVRMGGKVVFRGVLGYAPFEIDTGADEVELVLFDDKWEMRANRIGQPGIGTRPTTPAEDVGRDGFADVGFEIIFNRDGMPNKDPAILDFNTGSTAVYWTVGTALQFVFAYYIATDVARLDAAVLSTAYARTPSHVNLVGQDALQAVQSLVDLTGESWGLVPQSGYSAFQPVRPGAGTQRTVRLFPPTGKAAATSAGIYHADVCHVGTSVKDLADVYQAVSAPAVKEHTYSSAGSDPLLARDATFADREYVARFKVDVTKYSAHNLGGNLSSGSKPKAWLDYLLTRYKADNSAYLTAAEIAATPALLRAERVKKPLCWIATDGVEANARLVVGGMRMDRENGFLDFQGTVDLMPDSGTEPEEVTVSDWSVAALWLTVATVLEVPEYSETDADSKYLPRPFYQVIPKPDLVPERRQLAWLPTIGGSNNDVDVAADPDEETYVDVTARLEEAVASALAAAPGIETPLSLEFPFIPPFDIGDRIEIAGRDVGQTGDEVVTRIKYGKHGVEKTFIDATNVTAAVEPEKFVEGE